jgi:spoIIIJ-associated protein
VSEERQSNAQPNEAVSEGNETAILAVAPAIAAEATEADRPPTRVDESMLDDRALRALNFVRTLVQKMSMNAEVNVAPNDGEGSPDEIRIEIEGPDAGRIIGKKGNVLDAIQYLTARVAVRPGEPRRHVTVDAEGYRARHEDQLSQMAKRLAQRVASEGKVITFDPMNARERRIVHTALRDVKGVRTESTGEEPERRVQIIPDKSAV